jgi:hypothetical protein
LGIHISEILSICLCLLGIFLCTHSISCVEHDIRDSTQGQVANCGGVPWNFRQGQCLLPVLESTSMTALPNICILSQGIMPSGWKEFSNWSLCD